MQHESRFTHAGPGSQYDQFSAVPSGRQLVETRKAGRYSRCLALFGKHLAALRVAQRFLQQLTDMFRTPATGNSHRNTIHARVELVDDSRNIPFLLNTSQHFRRYRDHLAGEVFFPHNPRMGDHSGTRADQHRIAG